MSLVASLISARPIISLRTREATVTRLRRNFEGLALISASAGSASGAMSSSTPCTLRGRLASIDTRALRQASAVVRRWRPGASDSRRPAAWVQASPLSRCANHSLRTSSTIAGDAVPSATCCTSRA